MKTPAFAVLLALGSSLLATCLFAAQTPVTPIEVSAFNCRTLSQPGASVTWWEAAIDLNAKSAPGTRFTGRVRVALTLGFETGNSSPKTIVFYQSETDLVALETGRVSTVRFYLPPEITKRDSLYGAPKYYAVKVSNSGRELPPSRAARSASFTGEEMLANFLTKAAAEAEATKGLLMPQYQTPFHLDVTRMAPTPIQQPAANAVKN
jgi:hypothetical protein